MIRNTLIFIAGGNAFMATNLLQDGDTEHAIIGYIATLLLLVLAYALGKIK